jgi:hypothetical protein
MLRNPYKSFLDLLPARTLEVGTVVAITGDVATIELPGGGQLQARGQSVVGARVFVRDGLIEGDAPTQTYTAVDI